MSFSAGSVPNPDPTLRTIENMLREVSSARNEARSSVESLRDVIETRLEAMDKAIELLQKATDRFPAHVANEVGTLRQLHAEKFESIQVQFRERDTRTDQTSRDTKTAIDAALQAQKEAAGKSEVSFTKQIDQIGDLIGTMGKGFDDKVSDLKDRITMMESNKKGGSEVWGYLVGALGLVISLIVVGLAIAKN